MNDKQSITTYFQTYFQLLKYDIILKIMKWTVIEI